MSSTNIQSPQSHSQVIELNAGNLWTNAFLDKVIELNSTHENVKVTSLFGSLARFTPSARPADRLPDRDELFIESYIKHAQSNGISIRWTLNQSCIGSTQTFKDVWGYGLSENLHTLHELGVHEWTITSPLLIELVRKEFPCDYIEVSTIANIRTIEHAERLRSIGADGFNLSIMINRNLPKLKHFTSYFGNDNITLLANEACLLECPWRQECYNCSSHNSLRSEKLFKHYPFSRCQSERMNNPAEWIKSRMILPQWMREYNSLTATNTSRGLKKFKVAFRTHPEEVAVPILSMYMDEFYDGNLLNLWPTISKLAKSEEPSEHVDIPIPLIDVAARSVCGGSFLKHFMGLPSGSSCSYEVNGTCIHCTFCKEVFHKVQVLKDELVS